MHLRPRKRYWRNLGSALLLSLGLLPPGARAQATNGSSFRIAFTSALFTEVNENDARAAVRVWARAIATENTVSTDPDARIFKDAPSALTALQDESVDAVGMTIPEYAQVYPKVRLGPLFTTSNAGHYLEEYVLLVRQDSPVTCLADLKGRSLNRQHSARLCLARQWLDLELVKAGLKPAQGFFGQVNQYPKVSKVLLPVFFGQVDACLVSRSGFDTMKELNPQLDQQLRILLLSPKVAPVVLAFRANYNPPFKQQLLSDFSNLNRTPTGTQLLTIFQSDGLSEQPEDAFASALELLQKHARLVAHPAPAATGTNSLARTQGRGESR